MWSKAFLKSILPICTVGLSGLQCTLTVFRLDVLVMTRQTTNSFLFMAVGYSSTNLAKTNVESGLAIIDHPYSCMWYVRGQCHHGMSAFWDVAVFPSFVWVGRVAPNSFVVVRIPANTLLYFKFWIRTGCFFNRSSWLSVPKCITYSCMNRF